MDTSVNGFYSESVVSGIINLMGSKSSFEKSASSLLNALKARQPLGNKHVIPPTGNILSRIIKDNEQALADHGIIVTRHHSGTRSIKFEKAPSTVKSTKVIKVNPKGETIMETTNYTKTLKEDLLETLKEMGPIGTADIATLTNRPIESIRSMLSILKRDGYKIANKNMDGSKRNKLYYIGNEVKAAPSTAPTPKPTPKKIHKPEPKPVASKNANELVNRAYYLMKALRKIDIDTLMDHFELDEATAENVILTLAIKKRPGMKIDITLQDFS